MNRIRYGMAALGLYLVLLVPGLALGNPWNGKVVLQAFWWDARNDRYPQNWYTYLAKLAPRLLCTPAVKGPPLDTQDNLDDIACYKVRDPLTLRARVVPHVSPWTLIGQITCGRLVGPPVPARPG